MPPPNRKLMPKGGDKKRCGRKGPRGLLNVTLISEFLFSTKESTNSGLKYFKPPSQKQTVAPSCFDTSCYEKLEKV
jgi:hypothetical protein